MIQGEQHGEIDTVPAQLCMGCFDQPRGNALPANVGTHHHAANQAHAFRLAVQQYVAFVQREMCDNVITSHRQDQSDRPRDGVALALHIRESLAKQIHRLLTVFRRYALPAAYLNAHCPIFVQ